MPSPERSDNDIVAAARKQASAKHRGGSPAGGKAGGSSSEDDGRGRRRRRLRSQAGSPLKLLAGIGDPGSSTTAGSVGSSPALSRSTCRSGEDFSFRPPGRRSGRNSEAVALAGLSLFLKERFGSLHEAFVQMDFHRDGRISCLEFQEVLSGQERYCGLHEARELFCMLARGSDGWLRWDNFKAFLGSAHHTPESAGAYSGAGAPRDASSTAGVGRSFDAFKHELWALPSCADAGGSHGTGPLAQRKPGCDEADEVDTTMQSLTTTRSDLSGALLRSHGSRALSSSGTVCVGSELPTTPSARCGSKALESASTSVFAWDVPMEQGSSCSSAGVRQSELLSRTGHCSSTVGRYAMAGDAFAAACPADALMKTLDESLSSFRTQVAAVQALKAGQDQPQQSQVGPLTSSSIVPRTLWPDSGSCPDLRGLRWVAQLSLRSQGRLAACRRPADVLEILDEELDAASSAVKIETSRSSLSHGNDSSTACSLDLGSTRKRRELARPEIVTATAELLRQARSRADELEAQLREREQRHIARVAELKKTQRRELRRMMRRILEQSGPQRPRGGRLLQGDAHCFDAGAPAAVSCSAEAIVGAANAASHVNGARLGHRLTAEFGAGTTSSPVHRKSRSCALSRTASAGGNSGTSSAASSSKGSMIVVRGASKGSASLAKEAKLANSRDSGVTAGGNDAAGEWF